MQLANLKTKILARNYKYYEKIDSTQKEIWRLVENDNIENGTLIIANMQTNGVGTHGRTWHTDEIGNIAFSMYIQTNCEVSKVEGLTIKIAIILKEILKDKYNIEVDLKSPNDLMINNKKIGGILTESKIYDKKVKFLVIGIGINTTKMKFTDDIKDIATSIKKEFNIEIDNNYLISEFCNRLEIYLEERIGEIL